MEMREVKAREKRLPLLPLDLPTAALGRGMRWRASSGSSPSAAQQDPPGEVRQLIKQRL